MSTGGPTGTLDRVVGRAHTNASPARLYGAFVTAVRELGLPIEEALPPFTCNPAAALRLRAAVPRPRPTSLSRRGIPRAGSTASARRQPEIVVDAADQLQQPLDLVPNLLRHDEAVAVIL